jgi:hypothetical protein
MAPLGNLDAVAPSEDQMLQVFSHVKVVGAEAVAQPILNSFGSKFQSNLLWIPS